MIMGHRKARKMLLLSALLASIGAAADEPDYAALVAQKARAFFAGQLTPSDFAVTAPWRRNFAADNLTGRAPLSIETIDMNEVRLPDNPAGLEGIYVVKARLAAPAWVAGTRLDPGAYWLPGNITFVHTTRGWLVRDVDFAVLDSAGKLRGTNYLPWREATGR
jgi:hypothetical protein